MPQSKKFFSQRHSSNKTLAEEECNNNILPQPVQRPTITKVLPGTGQSKQNCQPISTVLKQHSLKPGMSQDCGTKNITPIPLGGQTNPLYKKLESITNDPWVLESLEGYKIEFSNPPYQTSMSSMTTTPEQAIVIDQEVQALSEKKAIFNVPGKFLETIQFISPLFTVSKKGGGHRPVINLKELNHFVEYQHFKMEGTVFVRINAAALNKLFLPYLRRLFEGGA